MERGLRCQRLTGGDAEVVCPGLSTGVKGGIDHKKNRRIHAGFFVVLLEIA
jgi:hypothetical protein